MSEEREGTEGQGFCWKAWVLGPAGGLSTGLGVERLPAIIPELGESVMSLPSWSFQPRWRAKSWKSRENLPPPVLSVPLHSILCHSDLLKTQSWPCTSCLIPIALWVEKNSLIPLLLILSQDHFPLASFSNESFPVVTYCHLASQLMDCISKPPFQARCGHMIKVWPTGCGRSDLYVYTDNFKVSSAFFF